MNRKLFELFSEVLHFDRFVHTYICTHQKKKYLNIVIHHLKYTFVCLNTRVLQQQQQQQ